MAKSELLFILLMTAASSQQEQVASYDYRLAFGSCFRHQSHYRHSEILDRVVDEKPSAFVWLGDYAYLDKKSGYRFVHNPLPVVKELFDASYNDPHYVPLRKSTKIYGVWDDHDSGINNSDKLNEFKREIRQMFLDSMDEPTDSPRRTQPGGMYGSYFLDPQKNIKLILLDNRYSRDSLSDETQSFEEKSLLGIEQEDWFVKEVKESKAQFTLIGIGNQIIPDDRFVIEKVFPRTRKLLLTVHNPNTILILLTGDVHFGEIMVDNCTTHLHGYPIYEFTSSGLTHSTQDFFTGKQTDVCVDFLFPDTFSNKDDRYHDLNYGILDFHIDTNNPNKSTVDMKLKNIDGQTVIKRHLEVGKDFPKREITDTESYNQCLSDRGSIKQRNFFNMLRKGTNPTGIVFYILLTIISCFMLLIFGIIKLCMLCGRLITGKTKHKQD